MIGISKSEHTKTEKILTYIGSLEKNSIFIQNIPS